eukprot:3574442-Prymnesium_polylepis.1
MADMSTVPQLQPPDEWHDHGRGACVRRMRSLRAIPSLCGILGLGQRARIYLAAHARLHAAFASGPVLLKFAQCGQSSQLALAFGRGCSVVRRVVCVGTRRVGVVYRNGCK